MKQEIAVGKKKKGSAVNHSEERFFSWLAQKAKEEHLRTKDKSRGPGARVIPGSHPKSDVSRRGKKWLPQKKMRKEAKEAKKESEKAEKKMKKMKEKISKL